MPDYLCDLRIPQILESFDNKHYDIHSKLCRGITDKMNDYVHPNWDLPKAAEAAGRYVCMYHPDFRNFPKKEFFNLRINEDNKLYFHESSNAFDYLLMSDGMWYAVDAKLSGNGDQFRISGNEIRVAKSYHSATKRYVIIRVNITIKRNKYIVRYIGIHKVNNPNVWDRVLARGPEQK